MRWSSALLLSLAGCAATSRSSDAGDFRERLLATIPEDSRDLIPAVFSADGRRVAWVERNDGACRAVCGTWRSRPYPGIC